MAHEFPNIPAEALAAIAGIASATLGIQHLEARGRDSLDFHDCYAPSVRRALAEAYALGFQHGKAAQ